MPSLRRLLAGPCALLLHRIMAAAATAAYDNTSDDSTAIGYAVSVSRYYGMIDDPDPAEVASWANNSNCSLKVLFLTYEVPTPEDELYLRGFDFWVEYTEELRQLRQLEGQGPGSLRSCLKIEPHFDTLVPEEGLQLDDFTARVFTDSVAPEVIQEIELQVHGWVAKGIRFVILGVDFEDCIITRGYLESVGLHHLALNVKDWIIFRHHSSQRMWGVGSTHLATHDGFVDLTARSSTRGVCVVIDDLDNYAFSDVVIGAEVAYASLGVEIVFKSYGSKFYGVYDPRELAINITNRGCDTLFAVMSNTSYAVILHQELANLQAPLTAEFIWPEPDAATWKELGRMGEHIFTAAEWHHDAHFSDRHFKDTAQFVMLYRRWLLETSGEDRAPTVPEATSVAAGMLIVSALDDLWSYHSFTTFDEPPRNERGFTPSVDRAEDQFGVRVGETIGAFDYHFETFFGTMYFDDAGVNVGKEFVTLQYLTDARVAVVHPPRARSAPPILPMDSFEARQGCPAGTYLLVPLAGNLVNTWWTEPGFRCANCSRLQYQDKPNQSYCVACLLGEVSEEGATSCQQCPPGYYRNEFQDKCTPCGLGAFSSGSAATQCDRCPAGKFANHTGQSECEVCPPGTFAQEPGGKQECTLCDWGSSTNNESERASCTACARNSYAEGLGRPSCTDCPWTFQTENIASSNQSSCLCPPGSYWRKASPDSEPFCETRHCEGALQCEGWSNDAPGAKRGYSVGPPLYRGAEPSYIVLCANTGDCPGDLDPGFCPEGHKNTRSCAECKSGYGRRRRGGCFKCGGVEWYVPLLLILLLACLLGVLLCGVRYTDNNVPAETLVKITAVSGIVLTALQILSLFRFIQVDWPDPIGFFHDSYNTLTHPVEVFSSMGCVLSITSPFQDYLFLIGVWPAAALLIFVLFKFAGVFSKYYRNKVTNVHIFQMEGMLALLFYTSISMLSLIPWQCEKNPDGTSSMVAYRQVLCWTGGEHSAMIGASCVAVLIFVVGFMSLIAWATYQYPIKVTRPKGVKFLLMFRWIFNRFEPDKHYYGLIYCSRNLLVTVLPVIFADNIPVQFLLVASILQFSVIFQCWSKPWITDIANKFDASSTVLLILLLIVGSLLISTDSDELATILSLFVSATFSAFGIALMAVLVHNLYLQLRPHKEFTFFLCHHKVAAAVLARWVKIELRLRNQGRVFLDSDELSRLDRLFRVVGYETENFVVLLTKETLSRIWCAGEITTALRNKVRIVCIACNDYEEPTDDFIKDLGKIWTDAQVAEVSRQGVSLEQIQEAFVQLRDLPKIRHDREASFRQQMKLIDILMARGKGTTIGDLPAPAISAGPEPLLNPPVTPSPGQELTARPATPARAIRDVAKSMLALPNLTPNASDRQRSLMVGDLDDPEAFLISRVLQVQLQQVLQSGVHVASKNIPEALEQLDDVKPSCLIAVLIAGVLSRPAFAVILAKVCAWENPPTLVPVVADGKFTFPSAMFWEDLKAGRVVDPQALQKHQVSVEDVLQAYKALFLVISKRFSSHGSEKIQWTEVKEIANLWPLSGAHASQSGASAKLPA